MNTHLFNQLLDSYRQQTLEKLDESSALPLTNATPAGLLLLRKHVQEWKHHYGQEGQAIKQLKHFYEHIRQDSAHLSPAERRRLQADEKNDYQQVVFSFQKKRDLIWQRQQQELDANKMLR